MNAPCENCVGDGLVALPEGNSECPNCRGTGQDPHAEVERLRALVAAAEADLEAGFGAQWPGGRRPKNDEGWMHFATALDHLRDASRPQTKEEPQMPEMPCACRDYCGDVPEDQDRPGSVCKLQPGRSAVAQVVLVDRQATGEQPARKEQS